MRATSPIWSRNLWSLILLLPIANAFGHVPPQVANAGRDRYGAQRELFRDEDLLAEEMPEDTRAFDELNVGLPLQVEQNLALKKDRNYILLIKKAPQYVFDFRTADRLRRSMMTMNTGDMDIGHAMIGWQCQNDGRAPSRGATGQTGESLNQGMQMIRSGWGLSTFMSSFRDGYLNTPEEVEETIDQADEAGRLRFLAVEVTEGECHRMLNFLRLYINHPNDPQRHFGLNLRPDKFEGGGCGSFAVTMLEKSGILAQMTPHIWRTLNVPTHLLGVGSKVPPYTDFYKKIPYNQSVFAGSIMSDYWSCRPGWAPCHKLRVADPEMILHLMTSLEKSAAALVGRSNVMFGEAGMNLRAKQRIVKFIDDPMSHDRDIATQLIDAKYDRQTALMEKAAMVYMKGFLAGGGKLRHGRMKSATGLILERGARQ